MTKGVEALCNEATCRAQSLTCLPNDTCGSSQSVCVNGQTTNQGCGGVGCAATTRRNCVCSNNAWSCSCDTDSTCGGNNNNNNNNNSGTDTTGGTTTTTDPTTAPTAVPTCAAPAFSKGSVAPSILRPDDFVSVYCDFGKRIDTLSVTGAGLTGCRYSRYEGTANIFSCQAGQNAGTYSDTKCVVPADATNCKAENSAGNMTILGTEVHYDQDVVLPFKTPFTLSAKVQSVIATGKGVRVILVCNSDTCTADKNKNAEVASIEFPESQQATFVEKTTSINLNGTGDDRHYLVRISVDKGSEAYFDAVSLKNAAGKEMLQNSEFSTTTVKSVTTNQPADWGEGDNKVGYYYGSLSSSNPWPATSGQPVGVPAGTGSGAGAGAADGPTGTPASVNLAIKIKLQGISKKPVVADPIHVQVKLAGGGLAAETAYKSVSFSVNDAGEWTGTASFDSVPTGSGYRVYVKGPMHIAKKICDAAPSETTLGGYHCSDGAITLTAGNNALDFSKIILLAGDLPEAGGVQNGIIDAYDTTFIRTNLGSTDQAKLAIGDLNLDGIIDTQDYSIILQSLSIKYDDQ